MSALSLQQAALKQGVDQVDVLIAGCGSITRLFQAAADNASVRQIGPVARHPIHSTIHLLISTSRDLVCWLPQNGHGASLFMDSPLVCHQYMKIWGNALNLDDDRAVSPFEWIRFWIRN